MSGAGRDLRAAILVGFLLAAMFLVTLFTSHWAFLTFVAVLVGIAVLEVDRAVRVRDVRPATPVVLVAGAVAFYGGFVAGTSGQTLGLVIAVFGATLWTMLDPGHRKRTNAVTSLGASLLIVLWIPFLASYLGLLLVREAGEWYLMMAVALTVTHDIGAYAFGSRWGRHRLAPSVSPGKTWEGLLGGLGSALLMAVTVSVATVPDVTPLVAVCVAVAITAAATTGDLAESLVKRDLGIKDLGTVLPGHGGVMDRIDATLFTLPTTHLVLTAFGL